MRFFFVLPLLLFLQHFNCAISTDLDALSPHSRHPAIVNGLALRGHEYDKASREGKNTILSYPHQSELHRVYLLQSNGAASKSQERPILTEKEFLSSHFEDYFGVQSKDLKLSATIPDAVTGITRKKYDQYLYGRKVFASVVTLSMGRHGGVINAVGHTLHHSKSPSEIKSLKMSQESVIEPMISEEYAKAGLSKYVTSKYTLKDEVISETDFPIKIKGTPELVWLRSGLSQGRTGAVKLVYHFEGTATISRSLNNVINSSKKRKEGIEKVSTRAVFDAFGNFSIAYNNNFEFSKNNRL